MTIAPERTAAESDRRQVGKDPWPGTFKQLSSLVGLYGGSEQAEKIRDASPKETNFVLMRVATRARTPLLSREGAFLEWSLILRGAERCAGHAPRSTYFAMSARAMSAVQGPFLSCFS